MKVIYNIDKYHEDREKTEYEIKSPRLNGKKWWLVIFRNGDINISYHNSSGVFCHGPIKSVEEGTEKTISLVLEYLI